MNNLKSLKDSIRRTGMVSMTGMKKRDIQLLRHKLQVYNDNPVELKQDSEYKNVRINGKNISLTDEQYDIVIAEKDSHYKIIACAGSGKTTTVLCRVKYLIDSGVKPYQILLTTFNVDAAENMRLKMFELFGYKTNIYVGTIDALAYRFYNAYFKRDDFIGIAEYCTEFLKFLRSSTDKSKRLRDRIEYVFFDEFQDSNDVQFDIVKEFAKTSRITVIGDDAQNIYQWRGSNMDYILNFENYLKHVANEKISSVPLGCKIKTLRQNFRSTPEIIDLANQSIRHNTDQIPKEMISTKKSYKRLPVVYYYKNEEEQSQYMLAYIIRYINNGIPQEEIAVLARNNYSIRYVEEAIEKHNLKGNEPKINYVALITDDTRDSRPKIMKDHVTLTTIHKSKGLEWDVVFLLSCNDDKFPSETTLIKLQEDRRLFYVAVTRAKRYLNFSFTSETISRFIGELNRSLYTFNLYNDCYTNYKNERSIKFKNGVTQLIEMLEPRDIESMRARGLIPSLIPFTQNVHSNHTYSQYIDQYYLQADYGTYIDRYISRQFGIVVPSSGGLIDSVANRVLHTVNLDSTSQSLYTSYNYNIQRKIDNVYKIQENEQIDLYTLFDRLDDDPKYIRKINPEHKKSFIGLINILLNRAKEINVYPSQLFVVPINYMPHEYYDKFSASYKTFREANNCIDIRKDIYNVSLCQNIYDGRRRLLYKDCFNEFDTDDQLYKDIDQYVSSFRYKKVLTKKCVIDKQLSICGEIDLLVLTEGCEKIIDFKCSINSECKLEWIIQLMMYSALYKHIHGIVINHLGIYNPLRGSFTDIDLGTWDQHDNLLIYMDGIRTDRMNLNYTSIQNQSYENA
jgi:hypothetical protein